MILYGGAVIYFKLTPDLEPVIGTVRKRLGIKNKESGIGD
jgi:hypothetical protein